MEDLKKVLREDEEIIFMAEQDAELTSPFAAICVGILFMVLSVVLMLVALGAPEPEDYWNAVIGVIVLIFFFVLFLICTVGSARNLYQRKKRLNLPLEDLKEYKDVLILTSERWIQKTYWNYENPFREQLKKEHHVEGDLAIIELKDVHHVNVETHTDKFLYFFLRAPRDGDGYIWLKTRIWERNLAPFIEGIQSAHDFIKEKGMMEHKVEARYRPKELVDEKKAMEETPLTVNRLYKSTSVQSQSWDLPIDLELKGRAEPVREVLENEVRYCPHCGIKLTSRATTCVKCGKIID